MFKMRGQATNIIFTAIVGIILGVYGTMGFMLSPVYSAGSTNEMNLLSIETTGFFNGSGADVDWLDLNGDNITVWPSGGGDDHDQDLNTSDDVVFNTVNATTGIELNGVYRTTWPSGSGGVANFSGLPNDVIINKTGSTVYGINCSSGDVWDSGPDLDVVLNNALANFANVYVKRPSDGFYPLNDTDGDRYGILPRNNTHLIIEPLTLLNGTQPATLNDTFTLLGWHNTWGPIYNFTLDGGIWDGNKGALADHRGSGTWSDGFRYYMGVTFYQNAANPGSNLNVYRVEIREVVGFGLDFFYCTHTDADYIRVIYAGDNPITVEAPEDTEWDHDARVAHFYVFGGQDVAVNTYWGRNVHFGPGYIEAIDDFGGDASHWGMANEQGTCVVFQDIVIVCTSGMSAAVVSVGSAAAVGEINQSAGILFDRITVIDVDGGTQPLNIGTLQTRVSNSLFYYGGESWLYGGTYYHNLWYDTAQIRITSTNNRPVQLIDNEFYSTYVETMGDYGIIRGNQFTGGSSIQNSWASSATWFWIIDNNFINGSSTPLNMETGGGETSHLFVQGNQFGEGQTIDISYSFVTLDNTGLSIEDIPDNCTMGIYIRAQADEALAFGDLLYLNTTGDYGPADCNSSATMWATAVAAHAFSDGQLGYLLIHGAVRTDAVFGDIPIGTTVPMFVSPTAGGITSDVPNSSGDQVQKIGYGISFGTLFFDGDSTVVEIP